MTDKLYFGAAARANYQPNTSMRTQLLKKLSALISLGLLLGGAFHAAAQSGTIFNYNQVWKFDTNGLDLGASWRSNSFNDTAWPSAAGVFATAAEPLLQGATIGRTLTTTV